MNDLEFFLLFPTRKSLEIRAFRVSGSRVVRV